MNEQSEIITDRFLLRPLTESDVTERYLNWLGDADAKKFISAAATTKGLDDLRAYVRERMEPEDALFPGIFKKGTPFSGNLMDELTG